MESSIDRFYYRRNTFKSIDINQEVEVEDGTDSQSETKSTNELKRKVTNFSLKLSKQGLYCPIDSKSELKCYNCQKISPVSMIFERADNLEEIDFNFHTEDCESYLNYINRRNYFKNKRNSEKVSSPSSANSASNNEERLIFNTETVPELEYYFHPREIKITPDPDVTCPRHRQTQNPSDSQSDNININNINIFSNFSNTANISPSPPDYTQYNERLESFKNPDAEWPISMIIKAEDLAKNGFFYLGTDDRVQCITCNGILRKWSLGDVALDEHRKHFPNCRFLLNNFVEGNS